jgi:hypothetical protein
MFDTTIASGAAGVCNEDVTVDESVPVEEPNIGGSPIESIDLGLDGITVGSFTQKEIDNTQTPSTSVRSKEKKGKRPRPHAILAEQLNSQLQETSKTILKMFESQSESETQVMHTMGRIVKSQEKLARANQAKVKFTKKMQTTSPIAIQSMWDIETLSLEEKYKASSLLRDIDTAKEFLAIPPDHREGWIKFHLYG